MRILEFRLRGADEEARQSGQRAIRTMLELDEWPEHRDLMVILLELLLQEHRFLARRKASSRPAPRDCSDRESLDRGSQGLIESSEQMIDGRTRRVIWLRGPMKRRILEALS